MAKDKIKPGRLSIKEWNEQDRPREKLMSRGASALTDAELLAVLIGSGTVENSAVEIGRQLLDSVGGSLVELGRKSLSDLQTFNGIGLARGVSIAAALELGRRRRAADIPTPDYIAGSTDIVTIFQPLLSDLPHEEVWVMLLSRSKRIIERFRVSQGGIEGSVIDPRIVIRRALDRNAAGIVLVHNHPSGNAYPSEQDILNTHKVQLAASYFDMRLLDHVIIADTEPFSFAERGLL
ncbi:DNA repair protein RadC [uncultured Rikenella sp.]|uniref:RadC family protein n=1 Tax=uncultured Rikenella sp. TaxID=368003 RepID=UPI0026375B4E|nr:DNA repair protein RadC [uncultured Rikenella sp.]